MASNLAISMKITNAQALDSAIPLLEIYLKTNTCVKKFFEIAKSGNNLKSPSQKTV